jgi:hypothetical protein
MAGVAGAARLRTSALTLVQYRPGCKQRLAFPPPLFHPPGGHSCQPLKAGEKGGLYDYTEHCTAGECPCASHPSGSKPASGQTPPVGKCRAAGNSRPLFCVARRTAYYSSKRGFSSAASMVFNAVSL